MHQNGAHSVAGRRGGPGDQGGHRSDAGEDLPRQPWHGLEAKLDVELHLKQQRAQSKQWSAAKTTDKKTSSIALQAVVAMDPGGEKLRLPWLILLERRRETMEWLE